MLKKYLLTVFSILLYCNMAWSQYSVPQSGKAYRILTPGKNYNCMSADYKENLIYSREKDENAYEQMWILEDIGNNGFYIKNGLTGLYIQPTSKLSDYFRMNETPQEFFIKTNNYNTGFYNILTTENESRGMHADPFNKIVLWYSSTTSGSTTATEWVFEETGISLEELSEQQEKFKKQQEDIKKIKEYNDKLTIYFTDYSCSELNETYSQMSDEELLEAMNEMPSVIQNMALKIKNNSWGKREKEFRIRDYKPYADADKWSKILIANQYSYLNNPTGICADAHDMLYIFVEGDIVEGAFLGLEEILKTNTNGVIDTLKTGLNIIPVSYNQSTLFVRYTVNTHDSGKNISDYPNIKIHIENGTVNGFFDKSVHTDEDWRDITQNLASHPVIQVKGERVLYHMEKKWITASNCCKDSILNAINWWDKMLEWDHQLTGWDKGIYPEKFNNLHCAITLDDEHTYQAATAYRTQYGVKYIYKLLPYETVQSHHDNVWGPGHELGHTHQGAIRLIGTTEISCNVFANLVMYNMGKYSSRGDTIATLCKDFSEGKAWTSMLGESKMRMFWQLYLYFHLAGHDTEFYPKLFALMRENRLDNSADEVPGNKDILLFAEMCCKAADMDLTEFFKVWGFFIPVKNLTDMEAHNEYLTVTQKMIDETLAKMASYSRKAPAIEFIEDRIEYIPRTDGTSGNRLQSDLAVGQCGDVGQYTNFDVNGSPEATGYSYIKTGKTIIIEKGSGAVGFKVYDSKGELRAISNKFKFTIPEKLAAEPNIKITAAEGDGDEVTLQPYAEDKQLEALKKAIDITDYYVKYSDNYNTKVGFYREKKLIRLKELRDSAQTAIDNNDQSIHTYREYQQFIDNELSNIYADSEAKIRIQPLNYYTLTPKNSSSYSLSGNASGLTVSKGGTSQDNKKWAFVTDDDSLYYIKTKSNIYIASMPKNNTATTTSDISQAAKFRVIPLENGYWYIQLDNMNGCSMGYNSNNTITGQDCKYSNSHWLIKTVENNQDVYNTALLDSAIQVSDSIIYELFDSIKLTNGEYTINNGILIKDDNITETAKELIILSDEARNRIEKEEVSEYGKTAEKLIAVISKISEMYAVIPQYPDLQENGIVWYSIQNNDNGKYLTVERSLKRYLNYLMQKETDESEINDLLLWAFIPTGNEHEYYIFNAGTGCALFGQSNLEAMGGSEAVPYTLSLDTASLCFTIENEGKYLYGSTTYIKLNSKKSYYKIKKVSQNDNALLAPINGECYGRIPYGKKVSKKNDLYISNENSISFIDLKGNNDAKEWINKCKESLSETNIVYYTDLESDEAANAGNNIIDKNGVCNQLDIIFGKTYFIPEKFTAIKANYIDENVSKEDIRPLMLPFIPENELKTAEPTEFKNTDGNNTLVLSATELKTNIPMFVSCNGENVTASAENVTIEPSSKETITTEYLVSSYVGTDYMTGTYIPNNEKYVRTTKSGTLQPFEINITSYPGNSSVLVSSFILYYDETTGIKNITNREEYKNIYDLSGRKIEKITKPGIYIIDNRKVMIKNIE